MEKPVLNNKIISAPLAGITDKPYRHLLSEFNPGLISTEMISVEGIVRENKKTLNMIDASPGSSKILLQIFGDDPLKIKDAVQIIESKVSPYIIDINMGCPVRKVVRTNAGAALLKSPEKIDKILNAVSKVIKTKLSIKIRLGWDSNNINYIKIGKIAEFYDISLITLHARTAVQMYNGTADWSHIKLLKESVSIPVAGNGDVVSYADYSELIKFCDYVMIGRGLLYDPFLITDILNEGKETIDWETKKKFIIKHLKTLIDEYGKTNGIKKFRKHFSWYVKNHLKARELRKKGFAAETFEDYYKLLF